MTARADIALGAALAAFGGLILAETYNIPPPAFETFGAAPVPRTAALVLIVLAVAIMAGGIVRRGRAPVRTDLASEPAAWLRTVAVLGIFVAHSLAIAWLGAGFILATVPALILMFLVLGGTRPGFVALSAGVAVAVAVGVFLVFTRILRIDLP